MTGTEAIDRLILALHDQDFTGYQDQAIRDEVATLIRMKAFDPYMPRWEQAPYFANYHTIDRDGNGVWWTQSRIQLGSTQWVNVGGLQQKVVPDTTSPYDMDGLDWRNSLRARPEVQP